MKRLPWQEAGQAATSESAAPAAAKVDAGYIYNFDAELQLPTRSKNKGQAEPGLPIVLAASANPEDEVTAEWPDGHTAQIPNMTYTKLDLISGRSRNSSAGDLFTMQHQESMHTVVIKQKVDRSLLLVAYEQTHQILMVKLNQFDKVDDERVQVPAAHPACVKAMAFLLPLIEAYCKGEVKKADLNTIKKEALARLPKCEKILKRPASSMASGSGAATEKSEVADGNVRKKPAQKEAAVFEEVQQTEIKKEGIENVRGLPPDWHMPAPIAPMESQIAAFFKP